MVGRESVNPRKEQMVKDLANQISEKNIIGIYDVHKMPAAALQKIKHELHGKAEAKSIKKRLLIRAIEKSNKTELKNHITGQPGILFTDVNPFKLYKIIQKSKTSMTAKPGDIAPTEIEVKAGPTEIMPGPAISALSKVGLMAKVEGGKLAIQKDKVVAKAGQVITIDLASVLGMLKIEPIEVGLNINAIIENGVIYTKDVLSIDEKKVLEDMLAGYHHALNLSIESGFITKEAVPVMITKAFAEARTLALEAGIFSKDIIGELLAKAVAEMKTIQEKSGAEVE